MVLSSRLLQNISGAIFLSNGMIAVIRSRDAKWLINMPLHKTLETLRINFGTIYKTDRIAMVDGPDYIAALRVLDNGKIDPVSIRNYIANIQSDDEWSKFKWIEGFYKEYNLPAGCGFYNQIDLIKVLNRP